MQLSARAPGQCTQVWHSTPNTLVFGGNTEKCSTASASREMQIEIIMQGQGHNSGSKSVCPGMQGPEFRHAYKAGAVVRICNPYSYSKRGGREEKP